MEGNVQGVGHSQNYKVPPPKVGDKGAYFENTPLRGHYPIKSTSRIFFLFFSLKVGLYPSGITGKNEKKKKRPGVMKGKMPTSRGLK